MATKESAPISDYVHVLPIRVYYEDTDAAGIVYHANYLRYAERARTEMLRLAGVDQTTLWRQTGVRFAVRTCLIDYFQPALLDDALEIHSRLLRVAGASIRAEQVVRRDEVALARLELRIACVRQNGQAARMPGAVRFALTTLQQSEFRTEVHGSH